MKPEWCQEIIQYKALAGVMPEKLPPTWEELQEASARLMFEAMSWVQNLYQFKTLSKTDQQLLLKVRV